jgi:hypothetical protein
MFGCGDVLNSNLRLRCSIYLNSIEYWLSQASHNFDRLGIMFNFKDYREPQRLVGLLLLLAF